MTVSLQADIGHSIVKSPKQKFSMSLLGGGNGSMAYGLDAKQKNLKPGFSTGLAGTRLIMNNLKLRTEILYISKGSSHREKNYDNYNGVMIHSSLTLQYIEIPIMIQFKAKINQLPDAIIYFGPYLGILTKSTTSLKIDDNIQSDAVDSIQKIDSGIILGNCYQINDFLNLHFRLSGGLRRYIDVINPPDLKNISLSIMLSLKIY